MSTTRTLIAAGLIASGLLAGTSVQAQTWTKRNGTDPFVHRIYFNPTNPQQVWVAADSLWVVDELSQTSQMFPFFDQITGGIRMSNDGGQTFSEPMLGDVSVRDILMPASMPGVILAGTAFETGIGGVRVSTDNGQSWSSDRCAQGPVVRLVASGTNVYAALANNGQALRRSTDTFNNCAMLTPAVAPRDISISASGRTIYIADQSRGVQHSLDSGNTFERESSGLEGLRVLSVRASRSMEAYVTAGADSITGTGSSAGKGIYFSQDSGRTFTMAGAPNARIWEIRDHPTDPRYVAAAAGEDGVWISGNFGRPGSWQRMSGNLPSSATAFVRTIAFQPGNTDNGVIVWAGVQDTALANAANSGLYISSPVSIEATSVEDGGVASTATPGTLISAEPHPFSEHVRLTVALQPGKAMVRVMDIMGREVATLFDGTAGADALQLNWTAPSTLAPGVYMLVMEQNGERNAARIVLSR